MRKFLFAVFAALALCLAGTGLAYAGTSSGSGGHSTSSTSSCTSTTTAGCGDTTIVCPQGTLLKVNAGTLLRLRVGGNSYSCYGTVYRHAGTVVYGGSSACDSTCTSKTEYVPASTASACGCDSSTGVVRNVVYTRPTVAADVGCLASVRAWLSGLGL